MAENDIQVDGNISVPRKIIFPCKKCKNDGVAYFSASSFNDLSFNFSYSSQYTIENEDKDAYPRNINVCSDCYKTNKLVE